MIVHLVGLSAGLLTAAVLAIIELISDKRYDKKEREIHEDNTIHN